MFTGIVQGTGKVLKIVEQTTISTFTIQLPDTDKLPVNEEDQEYNHIDLVLQIQNLQKALK